jgi:hypothetical protein
MPLDHKYTVRVKMPKPEEVNSGLRPARMKTLVALFGMPATTFSEECSNIKATFAKFVTRADVGPFTTTGLKPWLGVLTKVFEEVKNDDPELYAIIGTAGTLCARYVRGSKTTISNHSFGCATDLLIGGVLDNMGDGLCLRGLLALYKYFHKHDAYWGVEFPREDAMHYEAANELVITWALQGLFTERIRTNALAIATHYVDPRWVAKWTADGLLTA